MKRAHVMQVCGRQCTLNENPLVFLHTGMSVSSSSTDAMKRSLKLLKQHMECARKISTHKRGKRAKGNFSSTKGRSLQSASAPSAVPSSLHSRHVSFSSEIERTSGNTQVSPAHATHGVTHGNIILTANETRKGDSPTLRRSALDDSDGRNDKRKVEANKGRKYEERCNHQGRVQKKFKTNPPADCVPEAGNAAPSVPSRPTLQTKAPPNEQRGDTVPKRCSTGGKRRYILFAGDLPFDTTPQQLKTFFKKKLEPHIKGVRLLTQRGTNKSKGCAFVEFDCKEALQVALNYHHHQLNGRKINIELSAGGGGNSQSRIQRIRQKNKRLKLLRRKLFKSKTCAKPPAAQPPQ